MTRRWPSTDGGLMRSGNMIGRPDAAASVRGLRMDHVNVLGAPESLRDLVGWHHRLQELAADTPLGIPVSVSTDPPHAFSNNLGTGAPARAFSLRPGSLGFAALRDPAVVERFADAARQEYLAAGLRVALHRRSTWPPNGAGRGSG